MLFKVALQQGADPGQPGPGLVGGLPRAVGGRPRKPLQVALEVARQRRRLHHHDPLGADDAFVLARARALQPLQRELDEVLDGVGGVLRHRGDTEARDDLQRLAAVGDLRVLQLLVQAARERHHLRRAGASRDHDEGGLGGAADRVLGALVAADQLRDPRQQLVGYVLAYLLRHLGVAVDAERHDREQAAVAAGVRIMLATFGHQIVRREGAGKRVVSDGLLQHLLARLELAARLDQAQQVVDPGEHFGRVGFLGDEIVRSEVAGALLRRLVLVAGDDDDRQRLDARVLRAAHALEQLEAVELRHVDVGDHHDDGGIALDGLPAGFAVGAFAHREGRAEDAVESGADELRVVDDQDFLVGNVASLSHQEARSTTMRPRIWALIKRSKTDGSSSKGIVCAISLRAGGRRSVASRRHTSRRSSGDGLSLELMPRSDTPRSMKGITVVVRFALAARPIDAITPFTFMVLAIQARTSPPRLSTAPAQVALSRGLIFVKSSSDRSFISRAPIFLSQSASPDFPVRATTWYPDFASEDTAMDPTPPVAPLTIPGPFAGFRPLCSMRTIAMPAVNPAVPKAIAPQSVMPRGSLTSQSAGRRAYSE